MPNNEITESGKDKKITVVDIWKSELAYRQALRRRKRAHTAYNDARKKYDDTEGEALSTSAGYTAKQKFLDEKQKMLASLEAEMEAVRSHREELREQMNDAYDTHKKSLAELENLTKVVDDVESIINENRKQEDVVKRDIDRLKADMVILDKRERELTAEKEELLKKADELKVKAEVKDEAAETELAKINDDMSVYKKQADKISDKSEALKAELLLLENEEKEAQELVTHLENDKAFTEKAIEDHKNNAKTLAEKSERLAKESAELNERAGGLNNEYHALSNKLDEQRAEAKKERESYVYHDLLDEMERTVKEAAAKVEEVHNLENVDNYATLLLKYDFYQKADKEMGDTAAFSPLKMSSFEGDSSMYMTISYEKDGNPEVIYLSFTVIGDNRKPVVRGRWEYINPVDHIIFYRRTPAGFSGEIPIFKERGEEYYNSESFASDSLTDYLAKVRRRQNEVNRTMKEMEECKKNQSDVMERAEKMKKEASDMLAESDSCRKQSEEESKNAVDKAARLETVKSDLERAEKDLVVRKDQTVKKRTEVEENEAELAKVNKELEPFVKKINEIQAVLDEKYSAKKDVREQLEEVEAKVQKIDADLKECESKKEIYKKKASELKEKEAYHAGRYGEIEAESKKSVVDKVILEKLIKEKADEMSRLDKELTKTADQIRKLESDHKALKAETDELASDTKTRKKKSDSAEKAYEKAKKALDDAQVELEESLAQVDFTLQLQRTYVARFITRT